MLIFVRGTHVPCRSIDARDARCCGVHYWHCIRAWILSNGMAGLCMFLPPSRVSACTVSVEVPNRIPMHILHARLVQVEVHTLLTSMATTAGLA